MNRIVITDCDHPTIAIERAIFARAGYRVELARCHTADEVVAAGLGAVALLAQYAPITDAVLETLPSIQVVGTYGASLDNIDLPAAAQRGLRVVNVPDYGVDEVADHTVGLIFALWRDRSSGTCRRAPIGPPGRGRARRPRAGTDRS